jgi:D-amino-acid dehydrogenase
MKVLVLGAGVIGTTSAWFLNQHGHEVTVVDRQPLPGIETSFANGGQISVSHAEPWANPSAPLKVLKWLGKQDAPLLFKLRADPAQWRWGLRFLAECTPARTRNNIAQIVNLGLYSRAMLQQLRRDTGIEYDHLEKGILHFYTSQREFDAAQEPARVMREHGCELNMVDADEVVRIEPALRNARDKIVGGSMTPSDESGDARKFTQNLARLAGAKGVEFLHCTQVLGLDRDAERIKGVRVRNADGSYATLRADSYVVCMGGYSPLLVKPLGIDLLIYPAKGYSVTLPVNDPALAYQVSLTDDEYKLVFSRLGERLRIAGTAELSGYSQDLNPVRCEAIVRRTLELFPGVADPEQAAYWSGLRPATPSNVPYIGKTRYPNLYLNTGHGTLGWTHSCGSGRSLADIVSGRRPELDFAFVGLPAARGVTVSGVAAGGWRAPQNAVPRT